MRLGFRNRILLTKSLDLIRNSVNLLAYLAWLLFDLTKFKKIRTDQIKNILVFYSGRVGDMVNSCGVINAMHQYYPQVNIYYLTIKERRQFITSPYIRILKSKEQAMDMIENNVFDAVVFLHGGMSKEETFDLRMCLYMIGIKYKVSCDIINIHPKLFWKSLYPVFLQINIYGFQDFFNRD